MDVRAPGADPHARLRVVAITLYHGEGEGEGLSRSGAGSTHAGRGRYRLGIRCIIFILTLPYVTVINENLIANTPPVRLSAPHPDPRSGVSCRVSCSLVQGHTTDIDKPAPVRRPATVAMRPLGSWCARGVLSVTLHHSFR